MEILDITEIRFNQNNPRTISRNQLDKLKKSLVEFPQMLELRPLVIDEDNIVIGGNMRLQALQELGITKVPTKKVINLTPEQKKEFIVKDNIGYGEWDWEVLQTDWDLDLLFDWGLDNGGFDLNNSQFDTDFKLPDGDRPPFQQMSFTLSEEQIEIVKNAIAEIKLTQDYKFCETFGNENSNGNALYLIVSQWGEQRK